MEAGERAGVRQIVVVSIIGIDRFTGGFLTAKKVHEQRMLAGSIPVRILRAAQFHEFVPVFAGWGTRDGVSYLPNLRTQLVASRTVAEALADLAVLPDSARGGTEAPFPEIAGPREERLVDAASCSSPTAARTCASRRSATRPTPTAISTSRARCCRGSTPRSPARASRSGSRAKTQRRCRSRPARYGRPRKERR